MPKLDKPIRVKDYVGNEERKQWIGSFPRITYLGLRNEARCDALAGPVRPTSRGLTRRQCKLRAQFMFKALPSSGEEDGKFCWTHLADIFTNNDIEKKSMERWAAKNPPPWEAQYKQFLRDSGIEE